MFHILFSLLRAKYIFFWFIKAFDSKQIRGRTCKDCVVSREINTLLKMAVFGKSCWNVDTRKMLRIVLKRYFFGFIETLASKGILNTLKKWITSAMECADLAAFTFATWQMRSLTLQVHRVYFSRSYCNECICNFSSISCEFGHLKRILWLFFQSELGDLKKN